MVVGATMTTITLNDITGPMDMAAILKTTGKIVLILFCVEN